MAKKGRKGQKKLQGPKLKAVTKAKKAGVAKSKAKANKGRKGGSKAVSTNLRKMSFSNTKKIEALNADVTKVLLAPPKLNFLSSAASAPRTSSSGASKSKKKPAKEEAMVDVGDVADKLAMM